MTSLYWFMGLQSRARVSALFHGRLKDIARYLRGTKDWGIQFCRPRRNDDSKLAKSKLSDVQEQQADKLPPYPEPITNGKFVGFVDAAYTNDLSKRRLTTGYVFRYSGGVVVYWSKTQLLTTLSSTEAEFIAAVTAAKTAKYIWLIPCKLGFLQAEPTPIYEDNKPTIDIVAS